MWDHLKMLNYQDALQRMGGREDLYIRLLSSFVREYRDYPQRIQELIAQESGDAYVLTHSLKNLAASIGAQPLADSAQQMELFFKDGSYHGNDLYLDQLLDEHQSLLLNLKDLPIQEQEGNLKPADTAVFLQDCRKAIAGYSPSQIKKCRQQLEAMQWPSQLSELAEALYHALKNYKYEQAMEMLDRMEEIKEA